MKARISQLHNTELGWQRYNDFIPEAGELIIYDSDDNYAYPRLKIGDGKTNLKNLTFLIDNVVEAYVQNLQRDVYIDGGRIR